MKSKHGRTLAVLTATSFIALASPSHGATVSYSLGEFQTVDSTGAFPANNAANIDSFDNTTGTLHAPYTTTIYARSAASGTQTARRVKLYLQFDLSTLTTETISSATLVFSAYSLNDLTAAVNNPNLWVSQLTNDWKSGGSPDPVFQPAITTSVDGGSVTSGTGTDLYPGTNYRNTTAYSINVKDIVENWQGGDTNNGLILELNTNAGENSNNHNQGIGLQPGSVILNVTAVPEPASGLLVGLASGFLLRRRRTH